MLTVVPEMNRANSPSNIQTRSAVANAEQCSPVNYQASSRCHTGGSRSATAPNGIVSMNNSCSSTASSSSSASEMAHNYHHPPRNILARNQVSQHLHHQQRQSVSGEMHMDTVGDSEQNSDVDQAPNLSFQSSEQAMEESEDDTEYKPDHEGGSSVATSPAIAHSQRSTPSSGFPLSPSLQSMHDSLPYNWQAGKSTVKERIASMYNNPTMADVYFLVGKEGMAKRVPAHKFLLAVSSAVFDAMFFGPLAAPMPNAVQSTEIVVPDVEPNAFLAMLKFIYSDEVHIGPDTVMTTLYTAKKYAVPALEKACVEFLKKSLSSENAFMLLTQARLFDELQLARQCLEVIDKNTSEALAADGFTDIDLDTLTAVLERDTLGIREVKLFTAVARWGEAECSRCGYPTSPDQMRDCLGRALGLIRFPLMSIDEFANCVAQSQLLTDRELVQMFLYFLVNPKPAIPFIDLPRCCLTGKEQVVTRFCAVEQRWGYSGTSDRIRFMVNRKIFVVGFGLYGSIHGPSEYHVNIEIIHPESGGVLGSNDTTFTCDGTNSTFRVAFKEPVEILPNVNYMACATLKGPDSYYGTKGLRKITHESVANGKVTFQFTYAAGNNNGTSVEDGQIPEIIFYM